MVDEREAFRLYRAGKMSRHQWVVIMDTGKDPYDHTKKLPWWRRIFKRRSNE